MHPVLTFRLKVTLLLGGVIVLLGIVAVVQARHDMRLTLGDELERRGQAIAKDIAANGADPILTGDLVGLYDVVNRAKLNNSDVRYVLVRDTSGQILVNTFGEAMPDGLAEVNNVISGNQLQVLHIGTEEGIISDISAPILSGVAGIVRVGMSDRGIETAVAQNTLDLIYLVVAAVGSGIALCYWLAGLLTRPVTVLLDAVRLVALGDLSQRIRSPGQDEVGELGRAFNIMAGELETKEASRRQLMEKVIDSQEEERKRVARELHDELAQRLASALMRLEIAEDSLPLTDKRARRAIASAREVTEGTLAETRKLISDLRPTVLDDLGLIPAIRSYAENHLRLRDTRVVISTADVDGSLAPVVETAVFRIVQEALSNIGKHAGADEARIAVKIQNGSIECDITDDGSGFLSTPSWDTATVHDSQLGLRGMEERAALLGGKLTVRSRIGAGTQISFSIPARGGGQQ